MQDPQALDAEQEKLTAQQAIEGVTQVGAENQELLRESMARNYLQHCVNAAIAEQGPEAVLTGIRNALVSLILTAFNVDPDKSPIVLETIAMAQGEVKIGEQPLPELLMEVWAVSQSRQGRLNVLIGKLRDRAELDRNQFMINQMQQLSALQPAPEVVPEVAPAQKGKKVKPNPAAK